MERLYLPDTAGIFRHIGRLRPSNKERRMTGAEADGRHGEKLGYLGLGMMGVPMARRLLGAGHEVAVWNRSAGKAQTLVEAGAKLAANPREVATSSTIIFMCVTDA